MVAVAGQVPLSPEGGSLLQTTPMTPNKYSRNRAGFAGRLGLLAGAVLALVAASPVRAAGYNFRYYKFQTTETLSGGNAIQMSEFKLLSGTTRHSPDLGNGGAVYNIPAGESPGAEMPPNLIDDNTATKWFNFGGAGGGKRAVIFDFGDAIDPLPTIDAYTFVTAQGGATLNGENGRNPTSWILQGSNDGEAWTTIDVRNDYPTPLTQFTEITPPFAIPDSVSPLITEFIATTSMVVVNGETVDLAWTTDLADTVTLSPGNPPGLPTTGSTTVTPPITADTVYTLTADSAVADPVTKQLTVRSVVGGTATGRYVRFTPVATGNGDIQIADIQFYNLVASEDVEQVPVVATYTDGTGGTGGESPDQMRDANPATKWFSGDLRPVVFDFGDEITFSKYRFTLGGDAGGYPGRNPLRWTMEISSDQFQWTKIEDFTAFDYPMPAENGAQRTLPLPGITVALPPLIELYRAARVPAEPDDTIMFEWRVSGAETISIDAEGGNDLPQSGFLEVTPSGADTYTLSATNSAGTVTKVLSFGAVVEELPTAINYTSFGTAGDDIVRNGNAALVNDGPQMPVAGDVVRLRVTPDLGGQMGAAWFHQKVAVGNGFETAFDFQMTTAGAGRGGNIYGAEGASFVIQNSAEGTALLPPTDNGPAAGALTINFSTWDNDSSALVEGSMKFYAGSATTPILTVDLSPLIEFRGSPFNTMTGPADSAPYKVEITYAGGLMDVVIDEVLVLDDYAINLASLGAVDGSGSAYVGFISQNGGWSQSSDFLSWSLTPGAVTPEPLKLVSSTINAPAGTASFSWTSVPGTQYRIRSSTDLVLWTTLPGQENIDATGSLTSKDVTFPAAAKTFFRVEEE